MSYRHSINHVVTLNAYLYRHLNVSQHTLDGNYFLNKYSKNTDPDDVSLFDGHSYFPPEEDLQEYLSAVPVNGKEARKLF